MGFSILGPPLLTFVVYLWSRRNPAAPASVWMVRVPGIWLPWALVAFAFVFGDPMPELAGIGVAHLFYYIIEVLPRTEGPLKSAYTYLRTPDFMCRAFQTVPTGVGAPRPGAPRAPPQGGHQWGGGGRQLGAADRGDNLHRD
jgi:hypothetical protein